MSDNVLVIDLGSDKIVAAFYDGTQSLTELINSNSDIVNLISTINQASQTQDTQDPLEKALATIDLRIRQNIPPDAQGPVQWNKYIGQKDSIFDYWVRTNKNNPTIDEFLPNPKFLLYKRASSLLNKTLKGRVGGHLFPNQNNPPDYELITKLFSVLITQVVRLALKAINKKIKDVKIIVSFPNIYSINLIKDVIDNISGKVKGINIDFVYESDAVSVESLADKEENSVLIVDVGKGTTDIGILERSVKNNKNKLHTLSRTGVPRAGGYITFLIATLINRIWNDCIRNGDKNELENIIISNTGHGNTGGLGAFNACLKLEIYDFIEKYKSKLDENFTLNSSDIEELKESLTGTIQSIENKCFSKISGDINDEFKNKFSECFKVSLERFLESHDISIIKRGWFVVKLALLKVRKGKPLSEDIKYYWYKRYLEEKIKDEVINQILEKIEKAIKQFNYTRCQHIKGVNCGKNKIDLGVIVGRGSLFKPLRKQTRDKLVNYVKNLEVENSAYRLKLACVRGSLRIIGGQYNLVDHDIPYGSFLLYNQGGNPQSHLSFVFNRDGNNIVYTPDLDGVEVDLTQAIYDVLYAPFPVSTEELRKNVENKNLGDFLFVGKLDLSNVKGTLNAQDTKFIYNNGQLNFLVGNSEINLTSGPPVIYQTNHKDIHASIWPAYADIDQIQGAIKEWSEDWQDEKIKNSFKPFYSI